MCTYVCDVAIVVMYLEFRETMIFRVLTNTNGIIRIYRQYDALRVDVVEALIGLSCEQNFSVLVHVIVYMWFVIATPKLEVGNCR